MSKAASKFGIPIEELSRLKYAADLSDVSLQGLGTSVGRLSRNMAEAAGGSKSAAEAFQNAGIQFQNADGSLRSSSDVLADLADKFASMPDGAEKTALAMELMGRSGAEMIPLLNGGSEALEKIKAEADSFGQVFSAEMGANAEQFNDNLTRLQGAFGNLAADLTEQLLPHLASFTDWLVENGPTIADFAGDMIDVAAAVGQAATAFFEFAAKVADAIKSAVASIHTFANEAAKALDALPAKFRQIGSDIVAGLLSGLKAKWNEVTGWLTGAAGRVASTFKSVLGVQSPSRVFASIGQDLMAGLGLGLQQGQGGVMSLLRRIGGNLGGALSKGFEGKIGDIAGSLGSIASGLISGGGMQSVASGLGGILGTVIGGPLGSVIGSVAGGLFGKLFGGDDAPTVQAAGEVFGGTKYARNVGGRFYTQEEGKTGALALVQAGLNDLLRNFNEVVTGMVRDLVAVPQDWNANLKLLRDNLGGSGSEDFAFGYVARVQQLIAGTLSDTIYAKGGATEKLAQEIEKRVANVMDLVIQVATAGLQPLTEVQKAYRAIGERFNEESQEILRALGFTQAQIDKARREAEGAVRGGFTKELIDGIAESGKATREELRYWRGLELKDLAEQRDAALKTAREIGADTGAVWRAFTIAAAEINEEFRDMLRKFAKPVKEVEKPVKDVGDAVDDLTDRLADLADMASGRLGRLQDQLSRVEDRRATVLGELANRAEQARQAEQGLADAIRGLSAGTLAPGGPMDRFRELGRQFNEAIAAARGGDAEAASRAGSLASSLLEAGRGVFASGGRYADLFRDVNERLLNVQGMFDARADVIEKTLDAETFEEVSNRSTNALLRAVGRTNEELGALRRDIAAQTRRLELIEQRRNVGRGAA
jgi:ABC-type transporter Mla subunit MlaD